ncbi:bifunctional 5,10-methylenetetrahydrofolate dehydrogenase/5,10-methenyltetrahydrofolate cyclohydrolase [Candidatus Woesearchaeota archaeon]|nr:bifunctional 5,10-methylenetetrahydrofolate dehydrogenase/5,10-methenyltetrahydrofolate cyclohydrolase [Candidatus Woesearchaeota archaeon]
MGGKEAAKFYLDSIQEMRDSYKPCLAVITGEDCRKDANYFMRLVKNKCKKLGVDVLDIDDTNESNVVERIADCNRDPYVTGVVIGHPFCDDYDLDKKIMGLLDPLKDVEGLHPIWTGILAHYRKTISEKEETPKYIIPFTPKAIMKLLDYHDVPFYDKKNKKSKLVTVINYSQIVGLPLLLMLENRKAQVVACNEFTPLEYLIESTRRADIIVSAVGKKGFLKPSMVSEKAVVVDVGGCDVDFDGVSEIVTAITPKKGGLGPVTLAMVVTNLYYLADLQDYFRNNGVDEILSPYAEVVK